MRRAGKESPAPKALHGRSLQSGENSTVVVDVYIRSVGGESSDQVATSVSLMVKSTEFRILLTDTLVEVGKPPVTSLYLDEGELVCRIASR